MKIGFVGTGSIAKRHMENLQIICQQRNENLVIDLFRSGHGQELPEHLQKLIHHTFLLEDSIPEDYDVIFITNPTSLHLQTLQKFQNYGKAFFIEKPVFHTGKVDLETLGLSKSKIFYVACPLRYTPVIQYIKQHIDFRDVYAARAISSSYLPDWRPGTDYRKTYSARKDLGGGVSIDLIHEWDYITYLMGFPRQVASIQRHLSALEIDCEDLSVYIADYPTATVELHLDYFGKMPLRRLELFMKNDTVECDLINGSLRYFKQQRTLSFEKERNVFQRNELQYFFGILDGKCENTSTISHACKVLRLAEGKE